MPARHSSSNSRPRNVLNPARAVLRPATATNENSRSPQSRQRSQNAARLRPRRNRSRSSGGRQASLSHSRSRSRHSVQSGSRRERSASHADSNRTVVSETDLCEQGGEDEKPPPEADVNDRTDRKARKSRRRRRRKDQEDDVDDQSQSPAPKRRHRRRKEASTADEATFADPEAVENEAKAPKKKKKHKKSEKDVDRNEDEEGQQGGNKIDAAKSARLRELIKGVYERRCPEKLKKLPAILDKYVGMELEVYEKACRKYGETPEIDFSLPPAKADKDRILETQGITVAQSVSSTRPPSISGQPRPGSGGSWPFVEDFSDNSASSSEAEAATLNRSGVGIRTVAEKPPGQWQPEKRPPMPHAPLGAAPHPAHPPTHHWAAPPVTPWGFAPPPLIRPPMPVAVPAPSIGSAWGEPTGSAWGEPAESKSQNVSAPVPSTQVKKGSHLDRDLESLLYGDVRKVAAVGPTASIPAPPAATQPPAGPGPVPPGPITVRLETFLGGWRDSMGNGVYVDWSRDKRNRHGQLDVELTKRSGGNPIKLSVKQTGSNFQCGHYDLDVGKSNENRIFWVDCRNRSNNSVWTR
eukprot:TRINITY_DN8158_c0_g2_i1.p1 TRINITY_DN8158_c0_g2~~TRINITY_DN8158_c0_g2_i1.p1  ORF type:complete len:580 (-),score=102.32 TRINITY_DN8158_c0_g2_i1:98-1837(-)